MKTYLLAFVIVCMTMTSCFKDEPLNAECDILRAWVHYDNLEEYVWYQSDTVTVVSSTESKITFTIKYDVDKTHLAPQFEITNGATLLPASGTERDFSNGPQTYVLTSQDGKWRRTYEVDFVEPTIPFDYDFENVRMVETSSKTCYYEWYEMDDEGRDIAMWASGNGGFYLSKTKAEPDEYPTISVDGYEGKGVKLTTCDTGSFGAMFKMPLAAGNLFVGEFVSESALQKPLEATRFGKLYASDRKPIKFTGYYKYKPGDTFQDKNRKTIADKVDEGAIYAILYKNHDAEGNEIILHGDDVQTNEHIVAKAIMQNVKPVDEWTAFDIDFDYNCTTAFERETLNNYGYNITIVFSSSKDGAYFEGAIGSTLYIDNVKIICEPENIDDPDEPVDDNTDDTEDNNTKEPTE